MVTVELLMGIWNEIEARDASPGSDGVTVSEFQKRAKANIKKLCDELNSGAYQSLPARVINIRNRDGSSRKVSILCLRDRVAHRAVKELVTPILDAHVPISCHSYRTGYGVRSAVSAVRVAASKGYSWVASCDIEKYFDRIDVETLLSEIDGALPAPLSKLVRGCIEPMAENGKGIPQGSSLSPVLSNFYLASVDAECGQLGPTVRFSDNIAIMARTQEDAEHLVDVVGASLSKMGLSLNNKTHISLAVGMCFLGETV